VRYYPELPAQRNRAVLGDLVVVALVALFAWLGLTVNDTFDELASLGRGVEEAGNSVQGGFEDAGGLVEDVPIVGGALDDAFTEIGARTGGDTAQLGQRGESAVEDTARLLGWVTFALPTLVVLLWAVPRRVVRIRRLTAAGRLLGDAQDPERRRLLAMRAAFGLPYETLLSHTRDPIGALAAGDYEPLLRALFEDAGMRVPEPRRST
jgi:Flp pilus assembly pilin Flp